MTINICVITGSRSEYGILYSLLKEIKNSPDFRLSLVAGGMHSLPTFGNTLAEIERDGFSIEHVVKLEDRKQDVSDGMTKDISQTINSLSDYFKSNRPDVVLILGDRSETLAAAIAAAYMQIPVAHLHGGDNACGGLDELARGAITKLSHIHFPATKKSAKRIERMGEAKWRIFMVGSTAIDYLRMQKFIQKNELFEKYGFDTSKPLILAVQHSVTTESELVVKQMNETLDALAELGQQTILVYPNSDSGGLAMISAIERRLPALPFVKAFKSLPHLEYLSFMKHASVMVGNSSSGIIEAPFFQLGAVNIGIRQEGRERTINVIDSKPDKKEILNAIKRVLSPKFQAKLKIECKSQYGDGHASERIVKVLKELELSKKILQKKMMEE